MGWLTGWQYRRAITIDNQTGADLTDYQVKITLDSTNFGFNKANSDGSDIRFTTDDGTTIINHWIESWDSAGQTATIWVKVPTIPSTGGTIYMYYGNSSATNTGTDPEAVFILYDDFASLSSDWKIASGVGHPKAHTYYVDSGLLKQTYSSDGDTFFIKKKNSFVIGPGGPGVLLEAYTYMENQWGGFCLVTEAEDEAMHYTIGCRIDERYWVGSVKGRWYDNRYRIPAKTWRTIQLVIKPDGTLVFRSIEDGWTATKNSQFLDVLTSRTWYAGIVGEGYNYQRYWDWIRVRKYASPEPTCTLQAEEEPPEHLIITDLSVSPQTIQIDVTQGETEGTATATVTYETSNVTVTQIDWYVDGTLVDSGMNTSITLTFTYMQEGDHEIKVVITGTGGTSTQYTDQATTTVTVQKIGEWLTGLAETGAYLRDQEMNAYPIISAQVKYDIERLVDVAEVVVSRTASIDVGDEVAIYWNGEPIFAGYVTEAKKREVLTLRVENYASELFRVRATEVFRDKSPEEIVQYLIENYTGLQYASTETSGVTISKYVVDADLVGKVVQDVAKLLDWQILVDVQKRFYFIPKGSRAVGYSLVVGANCDLVGSWEFDLSRLMNDITLKGDKQSFTKEDTFTGDGTTNEFVLTYKPTGSIRVTVDGTEMKHEADYTVDADDRKVSFMTPPANGANIVVQYDYVVPIVIMASNDESIAKYGRHSAVIEAKWIKTMADARKYTRKLLELYAEPLARGWLKVATIRTDIKEGDIITVIDNRNGINQSMQVAKVEYYIPEGYTKVLVGTSEVLLYDWQAEVQERIKQLEQVLSTIETIQRQLGFKEPINVKIKIKRFVVKKTELVSGAKWNDSSAIWGGTGVFYAKTYPFVLDHDQYGLLDTVNIRMDIPYNDWMIHYEVNR